VTAAILSLGSVNADFQMRVPKEIGEIETQLAHDFVRLSGGKAANRAFLARQFGHPARLFGRVGDDELARQPLGPLEKMGVDITGVGVAADTSTAVSIIVVPPSGKKRIFLASNANACWDKPAATDLEAAILAADRASVLTVDYETTGEITARALKAAARRDLRVVIDPSPGDRVEAAALRQCVAVAPNAEETEALTGVKVVDEASAARAASKLKERGVPLVCVKLADGGALVATGDELVVIPSPKVEVVDTTGAGDAFTAALAIGLFERRAHREAACLAVAASAMAVTRYGSQHDNLVPRLIEPLAAQAMAGIRPASRS
jgi:ribokinase